MHGEERKLQASKEIYIRALILSRIQNIFTDTCRCCFFWLSENAVNNDGS